jgi:hypothetical protein
MANDNYRKASAVVQKQMITNTLKSQGLALAPGMSVNDFQVKWFGRGVDPNALPVVPIPKPGPARRVVPGGSSSANDLQKMIEEGFR